MLQVQVAALRLAIRAEGSADIRPFVVLQPQPAQPVHDLLLRAGHRPPHVRILDAQDELPAGLAGQQVVVQRRRAPSPGACAPSAKAPLARVRA